MILQITFGILITYTLLFFLVPKGNPINEALYLPVWWIRMVQMTRSGMKISKHKYGKHFRQYLCLYEPENQKTERRHVIIYIHGGGWQFSRPEAFAPNAREWVKKGYTVFMPTHRRIPFHDYHSLRTDLNLMMKKVRELMSERGLEGIKIIIGGMSSGANLAALTALDKESLIDLNINPNQIGGLFLLGAPLNLELMRPSPSVYFFAGKMGSPKFKKANPIEYLTEKPNFPILGLHGTKDGFVEYESAVSFYEKLKTIAPELLTFHTLENVTHLETAGWSFLKNGVREKLFNWLESVEKVPVSH